jgi:protein-tyrosine phosphatase
MLPSPIMMICAGNMCRSPFAEHYMRLRLQQAGVAHECFSRGLLAMPGRKVPSTAQKIGLEFGVDMSSHVSQTLLAPDVDRAAMIMVMEAGQRQHLSKIRPASIGKVFLLSQPLGGETIPDPMGRDEEYFRKVYGEITTMVDAWIKRFGVNLVN